MSSLAQTAENVVRKTVTVAAPIALAFEVFTGRIETWWPMPTHHIGAAECAAVVIEPRVGGRWFERGVDGVECVWGGVLVWEPVGRVVLSWQLNAQWQFDPSIRTEVEVRFTAVDAAHDPGRARAPRPRGLRRRRDGDARSLRLAQRLDRHARALRAGGRPRGRLAGGAAAVVRLWRPTFPFCNACGGPHAK